MSSVSRVDALLDEPLMQESDHLLSDRLTHRQPPFSSSLPCRERLKLQRHPLLGIMISVSILMSEGTSTQMDEGYESRTVVVTNRHGLHARPCSAIVDMVGRHRANVTVQKGSQTVDGASVLDLMTLAASRGTELVLSATGPDAAEVLEALDHLFANEFGVAYTD